MRFANIPLSERPVCPSCHSIDYRHIKDETYQCNQCRAKFTIEDFKALSKKPAAKIKDNFAL